jgi:N-methylhydantoinase A
VLAFGGAGPAHACHVAELLDSEMVVFPPMASVLSAFGTLVTPVRIDLVRSELGRLDLLDWRRVDEILGELEAEASAALIDAGIDRSAVRYSYGADMRYYGQANEAAVQFGADPRTLEGPDAMRATFEETYRRLYGVTLPDVPVELVTWRLSAHGPDIERGGQIGFPEHPAERTKTRPVWFGAEAREVDIYDRSSLAREQTIAGPAIIEERETTIVIPPGWRASVDGLACIIAEKI